MADRRSGTLWLLGVTGVAAVALAVVRGLKAAIAGLGASLAGNEVALFIAGSFLVFIVAAVLANLVVGKDFGGDLHEGGWIRR